MRGRGKRGNDLNTSFLVDVLSFCFCTLSGRRLRLSASALLPLWEALRLPLLSPSELLVVESEGLVPRALVMRAYRTHSRPLDIQLRCATAQHKSHVLPNSDLQLYLVPRYEVTGQL